MQRAGLGPQLEGDVDRLDSRSRPPVHFLAGLVQFAVMGPTRRDGEFIADLQPQAARLRKPQMMSVAGLPTAYQTGLLGDKPQMALVTQPPWQRDGQAGSCRCEQMGLARATKRSCPGAPARLSCGSGRIDSPGWPSHSKCVLRTGIRTCEQFPRSERPFQLRSDSRDEILEPSRSILSRSAGPRIEAGVQARKRVR